MKNLASFCLCAMVGIAVVALPRFVVGAIESRLPEVCYASEVVSTHAIPGAGVKLRISEVTRFDEDFSVLVEATNEDVVPYYFSSYDSSDESIPQMGLPELSIDGKPQTFGWCGTGLVQRELLPGKTVRFRLSEFFARSLFVPGKEVRVGYYFSQGNSGSATMFWTEPVTFSPEDEEFINREIKKADQPAAS